MKPIRWKMILRGGFHDRSLVSVFDHKPAVEPLSFLEHVANRAINYCIYTLIFFVVLYSFWGLGIV